MSAKRDVSVPGGIRASVPLALIVVFLCALLAGRGHVPSALPSVVSYNCFGHFYELLESFTVLGSPAQWMVALLGLCLYPAFSMTTRAVSASPAGVVGSSAPSTQGLHSSRGPGSHSIQLEPVRDGSKGQRSPGGGFLKRLRRVLAEGRAQARRLCGQNSLRTAVSSLSRKRSFASRSSKSEDIVSSRLSMDSGFRSAQQQNTVGGGRRGLLQRKGSGGGGARNSRWQPSMSRIASGQHLAEIAPSESSMSSATAGKRLEILSYNGFQAVDCISHEMTDPLFNSVREVVTAAHLLQFGAMIGEASAELALTQVGNASAVGTEPASLFGPYDRSELYRVGWELIVEEHKPGLHYWTWRRHLRKGLFMYKSKTVYETATTAQIMDFTFDVEFRRIWDESTICQIAIAPPPASPALPLAAVQQQQQPQSSSGVSLAEADAKSAGGRSAFMYARTKFPPPMASREYTYARRCWAKPDDGGCYCISRACVHPSPPPAGGRTVRVTDFVSGYVIRSSKGIFDTANPAVEVVNVYFEDSRVPSGIANMGIRRALWPMVQKAEAAFRDYLLTRVHGNLERPPPERPVATDALGAAMGTARRVQAARAAADADAASCMGGLPSVSGWPWQLASPYVLLYRGYMALWRGGRGALLSALGCCMSLWCNATGLFVSAMGTARTGLRSVASVGGSARGMLHWAMAAGRSGLRAEVGKVSSAARMVGHVFALVMWPWERIALRMGWGRLRGPAASNRSGSVEGLLRRTFFGGGGGSMNSSTTSTDALHLASHPLNGGNAALESKRISFAPGNGGGSSSNGSGGNVGCSRGGGGDGSQLSRGTSRRVRVGLARRCVLLAVKVAKVAGAGLLLGRATRTEGSSAQPVVLTSPQQQQQQQVGPMPGAMDSTLAPGRQQQQQRTLEALQRTVPGQRW